MFDSFLLIFLLPFYPCKRLNSPRHIYICVKREVIRDIYIRQILNKPADDEGEIVENKTGANISRSDSTDLKHI